MTRWRRWLAGAAALAGAIAPFAGSPYRASSNGQATTGPGRVPGEMRGQAAGPAHGSIDVAELARAVADQDDHVSAVQLATWIRDRLPGLRVIDLRTAPEYRAFHIPGAEHVPLDELTAARFTSDDTIVLYSEVGVHGGQAWVFLRALGHRRVFFLRGGLHEWLDDVMSPSLAADATPETQAAFARVAELSRWFGGTPRRFGPTTSFQATPATSRGRGC